MLPGMRLVLFALLALAIAGTAVAAPPEGFRESAALSKRAAKISGKSDARVYCAPTIAAWTEFAMREIQQDDADGLTNIATREVALSPVVCRPLEKHLHGQRVGNFYLADAMLLTLGAQRRTCP